MTGSEAAGGPVEVELRREPLYGNPGGQATRRLGFIYGYKTLGDESLTRHDGTGFFLPAGTWVEYGSRLGDLRDYLRRKYGRGTTFAEPWKP